MRATTRILVQDGYEALTTNRVAEVAGVSVGSLYQYFPNKEALVLTLLERHVSETMGRLRGDMPELLPLPVKQAVPRFVRTMLEMHRVDPALHRVFYEQLPRMGSFSRIDDGVRESLAMAQLYLSQHRDEIIPRDLELASFILVHTIESLTHAAVISQPELLAHPGLVDEISACVLRYLQGSAEPKRTKVGKRAG